MSEPGCLSDDSALAYAEGALDEEPRAAVAAHLDSCRPCRRLVSELARAERTSSSGEARAEERPLAMPEAFGRFIVLGLVGVGGMGAVYAAYDPQLDRKVALKLLHHPPAEAELSGAELLAEGKAMAQVMHPNVVAVHDVGMRGRSLFIAMEFVEGKSLRQWLTDRSRSPAAIVAVLVEAGRGLGAAHSVGLVHRDFKPDNVLITNDGRAKVTDFGLARAVRKLDTAATAEGSREISGTPAYMSPEQREGAVLDARSDQYSFAVTLFEALYGVRPKQPVTATRPLRFPGAAREAGAPIRRALARALAKDKSERFDSMAALLDELVHAPRRRRRRTVIALGAASVIGAAALAGYRVRTERARICVSSGEDVAMVWSTSKRSAIRTRFEASGSPFARDVLPALERSIDDFAKRLSTDERAACEATRVAKAQSEETFALRSSCLQRRLIELGAVIDLLSDADETVVENAVTAVGKLTPIEACRSDAALAMQPLPPDHPETRAEVERLRVRLAGAKALLDSGRYKSGIEVANACVATAELLAYVPVQAEAHYVQGSLRDELSDSAGAEESLHRAAEEAEVSRHDEVAAKARTLLVWVTGYRRARHEVGHALEFAARGAVLRAGGRADLAAHLENNVGTLLWAEGKYSLAGERFDRASVLWTQAFGRAHPFVADALNNRGLTLWNEGKLEGALAAHEEALALRTQLLGTEHPAVASSLNNLGLVAQDLGRFEQAREHHRRAIAIQTNVHGAEHPLVASAWNNLGLAELGLGENDDALASLRRAFAIRKATRADTHPEIANSLVNLAIAHGALHQMRRARESVEEAVARLTKELGPNHPARVDTLLVDARLLNGEGRFADAAERARQAQTLARTALGSAHPLVASSLAEEGAALLALGRASEAAACLGAVVAQDATLSDSLVVGGAALALAEALAAAKLRPEEIPALLDVARRRLRVAGARGREPLRRLEAFAARR